MEKEKLKQEILDYISKHPATSFAELSMVFGEKIRGEEALIFDNENIIIWTNLSKEFIEIFKELLNEKKIVVVPSNPLVYACDGKLLKLPIAKRLIKYKEPHWLPVVLWERESYERMFEKRR